MKPPRVEIGSVNIRLQGGQWTPREAEKMVRLMVQHVHDGLAKLQKRVHGGRKIDWLAPVPVRIPRGASGEEAARKAATEICRVLGEN